MTYRGMLVFREISSITMPSGNAVHARSRSVAGRHRRSVLIPPAAPSERSAAGIV
jgi:hypothetical protein